MKNISATNSSMEVNFTSDVAVFECDKILNYGVSLIFTIDNTAGSREIRIKLSTADAIKLNQFLVSCID